MHSIEQMVLTVTHFINIFKEEVVHINMGQFNNFRNVSLLQQAYNHAVRCMNEYNTRVEIILHN